MLAAANRGSKVKHVQRPVAVRLSEKGLIVENRYDFISLQSADLKAHFEISHDGVLKVIFPTLSYQKP